MEKNTGQKTLPTTAELLAMHTIAVSDGWHLKIDNRRGRVWVDPEDGHYQVWVWMGSDLSNYRPDGSHYRLSDVFRDD